MQEAVKAKQISRLLNHVSEAKLAYNKAKKEAKIRVREAKNEE